MSEKKKVIATPIHLKREVENLCGDAHDINFIQNLLASSSYSISENVALNTNELKTKVADTCRQYKPYERIQRVVQNILVMPINKRNWFIWDEANCIVYKTDKETITKDFNKKQDYLRSSEHVSVDYIPKQKYGLTTVSGETVFNNYKAPAWLQEFLRNNKPIPVVTAIPDIYRKFLIHLVDNDEASYEYILDWIAISLQARNLTYLTTIGRSGIGKGFLGRIIEALHGRQNSVMAEFSQINSNFTALFNEKTFIYLNEVNNMSAKEYALLKMQNEDERKSEQKGIDAEIVQNYANIYISSNNMDAIKLDSDDRRFSIVNLSEVKLQDAMTQDEIKELAPKRDETSTHFEQLAYYLMQRPYEPKWAVEVFKSEQTKKINDAAAFDWEKWIIDDFCKDFAGRTITCRAVSEYAAAIFKKVIISEKNLRLLSEKFKGVFKVSKTEVYEEVALVGSKMGFKISDNPNGKRLMCIKIEKLKDQQNHEVREVEND